MKITVSLSREFKYRRARLWRLTCLVGPFQMHLSSGNSDSVKDDSSGSSFSSLLPPSGSPNSNTASNDCSVQFPNTLDFSQLAAILLETEREHPHNSPLVQILIFVRSRFAVHGRPSDQRTILYFFTLIKTIYMMYK